MYYFRGFNRTRLLPDISSSCLFTYVAGYPCGLNFIESPAIIIFSTTFVCRSQATSSERSTGREDEATKSRETGNTRGTKEDGQ